MYIYIYINHVEKEQRGTRQYTRQTKFIENATSQYMYTYYISLYFCHFFQSFEMIEKKERKKKSTVSAIDRCTRVHLSTTDEITIRLRFEVTNSPKEYIR